jgi:uncharacterized Ntn-hydrolase superfamily protein
MKEYGASRVRPVHTYSIVAYDAEAREWGVAVQSHYFSVGPIVPWAEAGVGAVATQSLAEISYGPLGLELMRAGKSAQEALDALVAADPGQAVRQVAMVDSEGNVAAHTGERCIPEAGHKTGEHYSVQANLMLKDTVWGAMSEAFEGAKGDLAERMMIALEAAEVEGGDIRGKQSAALLVAKGEMSGRPWAAHLFDLRVEDHAEPLPELRRLLGVARAYRYADEAEVMMDDESLGEERWKKSAEVFKKAMEYSWAMPGNMELEFWAGIGLASAGMWDDAMPMLRRAFAADPNWRELVPRLEKIGRLAGGQAAVQRIMSV